MFIHLAQMLSAKTDTFSLTVARENETQLRVTVLPKLAGDSKLNRPLALTGTPEELDSPAFLESLASYSGSVVDLRNALTEAEQQNKAEAASTRTKTAAKKTKGNAPAAAARAKPASKLANPKKNPLLKRAKSAAPAPADAPAQPAPEPPKNAEEATQSLL